MIIGISKNNCPKCAYAKQALEGYDIRWLNFDTDHEAQQLVRKYSVTLAPAYIVYSGVDVEIFYSTLFIKSKFQKK